jgi:hypothetical protein
MIIAVILCEVKGSSPCTDDPDVVHMSLVPNQLSLHSVVFRNGYDPEAVPSLGNTH